MQITEQEGGNIGIKAFFANAGVTTQESRTYSITSRQMLYTLWNHLLSAYPTFGKFENYKGTAVVWIKGTLTLGQWRKTESQEPSYEFYELNHGSERTALLSNKNYFSAGFAEIFSASDALKGNIGIPVKCLIRVMWHVDDAKNYVACPYVIFESS